MRKKIVLIILSLLFISACQREDNSITISVASSLEQPIRKIANIYEKESNNLVSINSASSGTLKKQIENGADVDLFFSANEDYMNELVKSNIVSKEDIIYPISNSLVLIKNNNIKDDVKDIKQIINSNFSICIGEINTVPVGQYAKDALNNIGIFDEIKDDIVYAKDATTVLSYVESGNVDLGIVYKSDTKNLKKSSFVYEFPESTHKKIKYSLAPIKKSKEVKDLINLINSETGKKVFKEYGFNIE